MTATMTDRERALAAADGGKHAGFIQGLRGEQVYLAVHMDVPLPNIAKHEHLILLGSDEAMIAEVDRIAKALGVAPKWEDGRYLARHAFSETVIYEAVAIPHVIPAHTEMADAA